ncbi:MAG: 30S ribosomal protein S6 [Candidatus Kaiserbacteria bacterium]|nr:30S ribosomal protein S6 [Candidatus Kaiserbacteria bacterium]
MAKQDKEIKEDEILEEDSESRVYELGFHIDAELPIEEVKKIYSAMREFIAAKGTIIAEGEPEKIQLAYIISKQETGGRHDFNTACFCWIAYETSPLHHSEIIETASANTHIIRFIDLLTTKDAARHSVEMHELSLKTPDRSKETEADLDVELDVALEHAAV